MASSIFTLPQPLRTFFALFPLHTHPSVDSPYAAHAVTQPTLWVHPPRPHAADALDNDMLSSDVECLKWQAYLALRGVRGVAVRWDVSADGGIDGRLPGLHIPLDVKGNDGEGELLAAHLIPEWVTKNVGAVDALEGYADDAARDESRAWVALMEGNVHAALEFFQPKETTLLSLLAPYRTIHRPVETMLNPPPAPLTGLASLIPPYGMHIDRSALELKYKEAIASLSERLGTDKWFLGSAAPTALDALIFAYLHCLLHSNESTLRFEITRRVNLVAWERRVQGEVRIAFHK